MTTCAEPAWLKIATRPLLPTRTVTRFAIVVPASQLRFEVAGFPVPVGNSVRNLGGVVLVRVTLTTPAPPPSAGSPPAPAPWFLLVCCDPTGPLIPPVPSRVS